MENGDGEFQEPAGLRALRRLVTVLTLTMILGIGGIFILMFLRLSAPLVPPSPPEALTLPDTLTLPDGAAAIAFTRGPGWFAVVTDDDRILIYDAASGALRQSVRVGN